MHIVRCLDTDKSTFLDLFFDLSFADLLQLFQLDCALDHAECYNCLLSLNFHNGSGRDLSFEADVVASFYDITVKDLLGGRRVLFLLFTFFAFL